jgi:putative oxidoreductase
MGAAEGRGTERRRTRGRAVRTVERSNVVKNWLSLWRSTAPYLQSLLRIVAAFLFLQVGTAKLFAFPGATMPGGGTASLLSRAGIAGVLEAFGGLLLLLGLFSRPVAFLLSGEMAFAYFIGHAPRGLWPVLNHGTDAVFFAFLWLYFSAAGPGPWSVDALRAGRSRPLATGGGVRSVGSPDSPSAYR